MNTEILLTFYKVKVGSGLTNKLKGLFSLVLRLFSASGRGCCSQHTLFELSCPISLLFGTLVMLRGMLECVTWHLHIGELPATVLERHSCGALHLLARL